MDFEPCFKVHNLVSVHPRSIKFGQLINLNVIFLVAVSSLLKLISTISKRPIPTLNAENI